LKLLKKIFKIKQVRPNLAPTYDVLFCLL